MTTYRIKGPNGETHRINGPPGASKEEVIAAIQYEQAKKSTAEPSPITGGDLARHALGGATFQFGDELRAATSAGLGAMTGQGAYDYLYQVTRDSERARSAKFSEEHPGAALGAEVAGGAALGVLGGVKAAGTKIGQEFAKRIAQKGLWGRLKTASKIGAALGGAGGAVTGAGMAPEIEDIPMEAAKGAAIGTAAGAVLGPAFEAAGTGIKAGYNAVGRMRDPTYQAAKNVARANARAGLTDEEALERAAVMGADGTLAETSTASREMLETMTQQPGAARDMAEKQLYERSLRQGENLVGDFGPGQRFETLDALKRYRAEQASPVYEQAFAAGVRHTQQLESVFNDLQNAIPGIWREAQRVGRLAESNAGRRLAPDSMGTNRPSLRGWQYMKEQLDDRINVLYRSGATSEAGILRDTRARLLKELDQQNPTYKKARDMWSSAAQFEDMMEQAKRFMTSSGAEFENIMSGLSRADRAAVKVGAIQSIEDRIQRGQWTQDVAKFFRTPAMERKMRLLFDNERDFAAFKNKLITLTKQQQTYDAVRGGSPTARRTAAAAESNDWIDKLMEVAGAMSSPTAAARRGAGMAASGLSRVRPSRSEAARTATAEALLETDPVQRLANQRYMQQVRGSGGLMPTNPQTPLVPGAAGGLIGGQGQQQMRPYSPNYHQLGNGAAGFYDPFRQ